MRPIIRKELLLSAKAYNLLKKQSSDYNQTTLNILMTSDKGCVPHDLIEKFDLNILYNQIFLKILYKSFRS